METRLDLDGQREELQGDIAYLEGDLEHQADLLMSKRADFNELETVYTETAEALDAKKTDFAELKKVHNQTQQKLNEARRYIYYSAHILQQSEHYIGLAHAFTNAFLLPLYRQRLSSRLRRCARKV